MFMTIREQYNSFKKELTSFYDVTELKSFYFLLLNHLKGYSKTDLILKEDETLLDSDLAFVLEAVDRLKTNEPIQYIIGETEFYDLPFKVNSSVLIPRQETEELVRWILDDAKEESLKIIDLCCGSACIGAALKANLLSSNVSVLDVSIEALNVAKKNISLNNLEIKVLEQDILVKGLIEKYDVIVSNPPYVKNQEKQLMHKNVLDYEPHLALFVEDDNPLLFYKRIGELGLKHLNTKGVLYFEINEALGRETAQLLEDMGYANVVLRKDLNGRDRMMKAELSK
jgi:release factor glutamine methyltransferase